MSTARDLFDAMWLGAHDSGASLSDPDDVWSMAREHGLAIISIATELAVRDELERLRARIAELEAAPKRVAGDGPELVDHDGEFMFCPLCQTVVPDVDGENGPHTWQQCAEASYATNNALCEEIGEAWFSAESSETARWRALAGACAAYRTWTMYADALNIATDYHNRARRWSRAWHTLASSYKSSLDACRSVRKEEAKAAQDARRELAEVRTPWLSTLVQSWRAVPADVRNDVLYGMAYPTWLQYSEAKAWRIAAALLRALESDGTGRATAAEHEPSRR